MKNLENDCSDLCEMIAAVIAVGKYKLRMVDRHYACSPLGNSSQLERRMERAAQDHASWMLEMQCCRVVRKKGTLVRWYVDLRFCRHFPLERIVEMLEPVYLCSLFYS